MNDPRLLRIEAKMRAAGCSAPSIAAYLAAAGGYFSGVRTQILEHEIDAPADLPRFECGGASAIDPKRMHKVVVLKLNGGLGTGMGLEQAKCLLEVRPGKNFFDYHVAQHAGAGAAALVWMNSFATDAATRSYLKRHYPTLAAGEPWFCQAQVPRLLAREGEALDWPQDPKQEWCPPGHGDLYPSLLGSGLLHRWLAEGREFLFAANGDNLGATLDPRLLDYFAASGLDFLMEVCERTEADRKGGHLARRRADGTLILRERAQTRPDEVVAFEDFRRHRYFNSNNLWIRLKALDAALRQHKGALPLPLIVNAKQLGTGSAARAVVQLESAMGAAIERFSRAGAIVVRRDRFLPVKDTNDLLRLRSDCYVDAGDGCLRLADSVDAAPRVRLSEHYRTFAEFARLCAAGVPSLRQCVELEIDGALNLSSQVVCRGRVRFVGASGVIPPGVYENCEVAI